MRYAAASVLTPRTIDNVTLTERTDFPAFVRDVLLGGGGVGSLRSDSEPLDWVFRAYKALAGSPYAGRLARGVAACLTAPEPEVRAQALVFFQTHPDAEGGERVCELVAGDRRLFRGVTNPMHPRSDLDRQLLTALAARVALGDPKALDLARAEVLESGRAGPLIGELATAAPDWLASHAEDIVRATPSSGSTMLIHLQKVVPDLVALGRRIAPLCQGDPRFELDIPRFIDDRATAQALLDLFRAAAPPRA